MFGFDIRNPYQRHYLRHGMQLFINAAASLSCAAFATLGCVQCFVGNWDAATAMFAGGILVRLFVKD